MFLNYFFYLRDILPVSITEFLTLLEALNKRLLKNMDKLFFKNFKDIEEITNSEKFLLRHLLKQEWV